MKRAIAVSAFNLTQAINLTLQASQVLPGLEISLVQDILTRSQNEDDGEIIRSLIKRFIR